MKGYGKSNPYIPNHPLIGIYSYVDHITGTVKSTTITALELKYAIDVQCANKEVAFRLLQEEWSKNRHYSRLGDIVIISMDGITYGPNYMTLGTTKIHKDYVIQTNEKGLSVLRSLDELEG